MSFRFNARKKARKRALDEALPIRKTLRRAIRAGKASMWTTKRFDIDGKNVWKPIRMDDGKRKVKRFVQARRKTGIRSWPIIVDARPQVIYDWLRAQEREAKAGAG